LAEVADGFFSVVLVVDDDRTQVALLTSFLKKAGYRVVTAPSGVSALAALEKVGNAGNDISLLVTDLDMPGMDGRAFAQEMRKQHPTLKVLYVTANANDLFQNAPLLGEGEAFLEKPVTQQVFREAVNLLLRHN
jgi:two-component system cell cycle sensor histidine kinase/response regulator CckA